MTTIPRPPSQDGQPEVRVRQDRLNRTSTRDWLIRFTFGAGVSTLAGVVSTLGGPRLGGVFLCVAAAALPRWPVWVALGAASLAWFSVAIGGYLVACLLGHGDDQKKERR